MQLESPQREAPLVLLGIGAARARLELRAALERGGLRVAEAADLEACVDALERLEPALVIAGSLPSEPDPVRVCGLLGGACAQRHTPIVLLIDGMDARGMQRAYDAGAADFIVQPPAGSQIAGSEIAQRMRFVLRAHGTLAADLRDANSIVGPAQLLADLRECMERSKKSERRTAVLCIDLHRFKALTASLDGAQCERLLLDVARRLRIGIRDGDLLASLGLDRDGVSVARLRGDEFCVLIRDARETSDLSRISQRILDLMAVPFQVGEQETILGVSIGIACYPDVELSAEALLKAAEQAAYCANQEGRNNWLFYRHELEAKASRRLALELGLRRALERNELELDYQPRVDIKSGQIVGVEALVRWNHPELGRVSPLDFIPLTEETGLIIPIGEWILATACEQNRRWQVAGIPPIRMAVNLSSVQFRQRDLYDSVVAILDSTGLDPRWLEFEITESLLMRDAESAVALLQRFKDLGLHLSIDDFGTGYSSLSYLKRFPIDAIKIDQSFVREMTTRSDDAALVTAIILMSRSMKLRVVAEGVETRSQLALLRILQCDEIQGYLISRPVSAVAMAALLRGSVPAAFAA